MLPTIGNMVSISLLGVLVFNRTRPFDPAIVNGAVFVRHVSLFAIIAAPILLKSGENIIRRFSKPWLQFYRQRNTNLNEIETRLRGYLWPSVAILLICCLGISGNLRYKFNEKVFPVAAVEFLLRETIAGKMFNDDEFGDYMIFAAWPKYRVFMDGHSDMYSEKYGNAYLKVAQALPGWKDVLAQFNINWIIFDTDSPLTAALRKQSEQQAIYSDKFASIFVRYITANSALLARYPAVKEKTEQTYRLSVSYIQPDRTHWGFLQEFTFSASIISRKTPGYIQPPITRVYGV